MGKGHEQTLLQGGHTEGPETYERMLSITSHPRDANYNHSEIPLYTGENADWCSHCGKQYGISLKKLKMELSFDPKIAAAGNIP